MVQRPLVVHAGDHRLDRFAIAEGQHADLGAGEEFLHHHMVAGGTELFVQHDLLHAVLGLLLVLADEYTLAQRQTVRLDDHRVFVFAADVVHHFGRVIKGLIVGGGDAVLFHQIFAEHLAGLDAGRGGVGAEGGNAHRGQCVHHAKGQRVILRHHHIVKGFFFGKGHHGLHIGGSNGLAFGIVADAAVAGCAPDLGAVGAFFQRPDDGVLAAAAANNQNLHLQLPPLWQYRTIHG